MKLQKEKSAAATNKAKRRLSNPLNEAQKAEKAAADEAKGLRKIQRTVDKSNERARAEVERRRATGAEGLTAEASRNSTRRKLHPLPVDEKVEKTRAEAHRRSVAWAELLAAEATRKSARRKTNLPTNERKAKTAVADATRYRQTRLTVEQKAEKLELRPKDWMRKVHKLQLFDYFISVIVVQLDLRRLPIPLLQML